MKRTFVISCEVSVNLDHFTRESDIPTESYMRSLRVELNEVLANYRKLNTPSLGFSVREIGENL